MAEARATSSAGIMIPLTVGPIIPVGWGLSVQRVTAKFITGKLDALEMTRFKAK